MNQTWKNGEKPKFGLDFGVFDLNFGPLTFLAGFTSNKFELNDSIELKLN